MAPKPKTKEADLTGFRNLSGLAHDQKSTPMSITNNAELLGMKNAGQAVRIPNRPNGV